MPAALQCYTYGLNMGAVFQRNWRIAGRTNVILLGWLTPFVSLLFTWLATLAEWDLPGMINARMNVFYLFTVAVVYLFTNALVTWLATAYLARSDFETSSLELVKLTRVGPAGLLFGHLLTVSAVMLPQIILFHAGLWVYTTAVIVPQDPSAQVSSLLLLGVLAMNIVNFISIAVITLFSLFVSPHLFVILGAILAFSIVQGNFMLFLISARFGTPIVYAVLVSLVPVMLCILPALLFGKRRWYAGWSLRWKQPRAACPTEQAARPVI